MLTLPFAAAMVDVRVVTMGDEGFTEKDTLVIMSLLSRSFVFEVLLMMVLGRWLSESIILRVSPSR